MKEHGKMTKRMVLVITHIIMEAGTKDNGQKTNKMAKELKNGQMVQNTLDSIKKVKSTEQENLFGLIRAPTKATFLIIIFME